MKAPAHIDAEGSAGLRQRIESALDQAARQPAARTAVAVFCFAIVITLSYRPFSQMVIGDTAFYDYIAQSILRGQLPYRDTVDIKFPGAAYLSALAMAVGHLVGLRDVLAVRALYLLLTGLFSALIFLVAAHYLRSRLAGVIAALIPVGLPRFGEWVTSGTEPKLPLMVAGLLALLMIAKGRPFWSGFCGMLACLFWQPGLMFVGAAGLVFSRYLTSWRDLRAVKVVIGAALPLAVVLLYFYFKGALGDLWAWTITYNYSVFGPDAERGVIEAIVHVWKIAGRVFQNNIALVPLSIIGFALFAAARLKEKRHLRRALQSADLYRDALLWPPLVYFAFSLVNFQAGPDLLPFLPFIAIFAGWFFVEAGRWLASREALSRHLSKWGPRIEWRVVLPALAFGLLLLVALFNSVTYRLSTWTLRGQEEVLKPVTSALGPDDKIYVHGTTELLVLMNRANLNPYLFLDWGADEFAAQRRGVPFSELVAEMEAQAPKVVALSRLKVVRRRDDFLRWVEAHYTPMNVPGYEGSIYIRKP
ncbi:MAG: hypothetical protein ACJ74J_23705 [Blastocatellia bacterium]